jgi:hypothetical protein
MYRESFFYSYFFDPDDPAIAVVDRKHAISIHCDACGKFGVLAPAALCALLPDSMQPTVLGDGTLSNVMFSSARLRRP